MGLHWCGSCGGHWEDKIRCKCPNQIFLNLEVVDLSNLSDEELYKLWKKYKLAIKALPDDPIPSCGYRCFSTTKLFELFGKKDPFIRCCMIHDIEYGRKIKPKKVVDREFYECCKDKAGNNPLLQGLALTYYSVVKLFGGLFW